MKYLVFKIVQPKVRESLSPCILLARVPTFGIAMSLFCHFSGFLFENKQRCEIFTYKNFEVCDFMHHDHLQYTSLMFTTCEVTRYA